MSNKTSGRGSVAAALVMLVWAVLVVVTVTVASTLTITGVAVNWWIVATIILGTFVAMLLAARWMLAREDRARKNVATTTILSTQDRDLIESFHARLRENLNNPKENI